LRHTIEAKPAVKILSASPSPGIVTVPRSIVQVPMAGDEPTGSGGVAEDVSMLSGDDEVNEGEDEKSGHPDSLNETPAVQYDFMADLLHTNMFKVYSDMLWSDSLRIQKIKSGKFGYLPIMSVTTLGDLNTESFCECVLSCLKLVVSDFHVCLKAEEIRILVMIRMNHEFMEYMRVTYPDTPLSEFKEVDTYVHTRGGVQTLDDDEDDE